MERAPFVIPPPPHYVMNMGKMCTCKKVLVLNSAIKAEQFIVCNKLGNLIQARIAKLVAYQLGTREVLDLNPGKGKNFSVKTFSLYCPFYCRSLMRNI